MTVERIIQLLQSSGADDWELTATGETGWEFYYIRHALDQNRFKQVEHIRVKVYRRLEDGQYLGSASGEISPSATEAEAAQIIDGLLLTAAYVRNPMYTLSDPRPVPMIKREAFSAAGITADYLKVMQSLPETAGADVNSWELFVSEKRRRFVSSRGIDVEATYPTSMLEAVVNARDSLQEIELYRLYHAGTCDVEGLREDLTRALAFGADKLRARTTPALGKAAVLFSTDAATDIYRYFISRLNAAAKVRGFSDWEIGRPVSENLTGDRITVRTKLLLPCSPYSLPFDMEGAPIGEKVILREGVPEAFCGSRQFSQYLGLEDSFDPQNFAVEGGTATEAELRQGSYLEVVEFSDFQVDSLTGDIAGEIRLAYWHDGDRVIPVSGGSVSGSMKDFVKTLRASAAQRQYGTLLMPALTRLEGVTITGA